MQEVVLNDLSAPVPDVLTLADVTADCSLDILVDPTATDNCSGFVTVSNDATLPFAAVGTYVVTWMYTDATGNNSAQTQNVIIQDVCRPITSKKRSLKVFGGNVLRTHRKSSGCPPCKMYCLS